MKHLGKYVLIFALLFSVFGGLNVTKTFAVGTSTPAGTPLPSKQEMLDSGTSLFTTFLSELDQKVKNPKQDPVLGKFDQKVIDLYVKGSGEFLMPSVENAKKNFIETLNNPAVPSQNIYAIYSAALIKAKGSLNKDQEATSQIRTNPLLRVEVKTLSTRLDDEILKKQRELIDSGDTKAAAEIQNGVGEQTKTQLKNDLGIGKCTTLWNASMVDCLDAAVNWIVKNIFLEFAGFLLWACANIFNYSIQIGILNFSKWAPDTLYPIWVIIRQIVSLVIIFAGLYLGFLYIIGKEEKFEKYIPWVILFALFVNFSYPLARTAVDISNTVSLKIYASAVGESALTAGPESQSTAGAKIMNSLGLQGLIMSATKVESNSSMASQGLLKNLNSTPATLAAVAYVLYAAYIFFMVTALIILRTASLVFIIVASPFLLVDSVVPLLGEAAVKLRKLFFEQLIVGPVFMVMLALTLKFLQVFSTNGVLTTAGSQDTIKTFFNILMMLIMLHITLKVTKEVSSTLGKHATDAMGKVGGFGLGVASGGAGFLARGTFGRAAAAVRDSNWVQNNQDGIIGRGVHRATNSLATGTYDLRNSKVVAGRMDRIGLGMGMGSTMGYEQAQEERKKKIDERMTRIGTYTSDVYENGRLVHQKGDLRNDDQAKAMRAKYARNAGGAVFGRDELKDRLENKKNVLEKEAGRKAKSARMEHYDNLQTNEEKEKFVKGISNEKEKAEVQEYAWRNVLDEYKKLLEEHPPGTEENDKKHTDFKNKQTTYNKNKLSAYDAKKASELEEQKKRKDEAAEVLKTNKDLAEAQVKSAEAMKALAEQMAKAGQKQVTSNGGIFGTPDKPVTNFPKLDTLETSNTTPALLSVNDFDVDFTTLYTKEELENTTKTGNATAPSVNTVISGQVSPPNKDAANQAPFKTESTTPTVTTTPKNEGVAA